MNILDSIEARLNNIENLLLDIKHTKSSGEPKKKVPRKEAAKILHCSEKTLDEMTVMWKDSGLAPVSSITTMIWRKRLRRSKHLIDVI